MDRFEIANNWASVTRIARKQRRLERMLYMQYVMLAVILIALTIGAVALTDDLKTIQAGINDGMTGQCELTLTVDEIKAAVAPEDYYPLTPYETSLIAQVIVAEAGNQEYDGKMAVAQVIRDRAIAWDMSVIDVIYQDGQFAAPLAGEPDKQAYDAVREVFGEGISVLEYPTTHFCTKDVTPYWTEDKMVRGTIGDHRFYY